MEGKKIETRQSTPSFWVRQSKPSIKAAYLCLYSIIIIFLYVYHYHISPTYGDVIAHNIPEVDFAKPSKCAIPYSTCEYDRLTGWNIGRFFIFSFVGWINPDNYMNIGVFSVIISMMTGSNKGNPRILSTLTTNMAGYVVGSNIRQLARPRPLQKYHI